MKFYKNSTKLRFFLKNKKINQKFKDQIIIYYRQIIQKDA